MNPIKIEYGKEYLTRDGRKARICGTPLRLSNKLDVPYFPVHSDDEKEIYWVVESGLFHPLHENESLDLISEIT